MTACSCLCGKISWLYIPILICIHVPSVQAPRDAKQQIEDAMMAVMEKRHAMDDAAHGQSSNGHAS